MRTNSSKCGLPSGACRRVSAPEITRVFRQAGHGALGTGFRISTYEARRFSQKRCHHFSCGAPREGYRRAVPHSADGHARRVRNGAVPDGVSSLLRASDLLFVRDPVCPFPHDRGRKSGKRDGKRASPFFFFGCGRDSFYVSSCAAYEQFTGGSLPFAVLSRPRAIGVFRCPYRRIPGLFSGKERHEAHRHLGDRGTAREGGRGAFSHKPYPRPPEGRRSGASLRFRLGIRRPYLSRRQIPP